MRILNNQTGQALEDICLYLTPAEAKEMMGALENLLINRSENHAHLSDNSYQREVTLAIYTDDNLDEFDERSRKLIREGI
jgi:hypothetical protein